MTKVKATSMNWRERISVNPEICHGKACINGTRVMVSVVLDNLAAGEMIEEIMRGYGLHRDNISASLAYAAELARERNSFRGSGTTVRSQEIGSTMFI